MRQKQLINTFAGIKVGRGLWPEEPAELEPLFCKYEEAVKRNAAAVDELEHKCVPEQPKPETRNLKPETRNPKPEIRNPKLEAQNLTPESRNLKPDPKFEI